MNAPQPPAVATILVVDDTPANISVLLGLLGDEGHQVLVATDGESALEQLQFARPDLILLDVMMPGLDGFEVCRRVKQNGAWGDVPVLFLTALDEPEEMLRGFAAGAADYVSKPLRHAEVMARVNVHLALHQLGHRLRDLNHTLEQRVAERTAELERSNAELGAALREIDQLRRELQRENTYLREALHEQTPQRTLIGHSAPLEQVLASVARVAPTASTVLITGETGTGKELVARAIHECSPRAERAMIKLNCAAIAAGLVESELFGHVKGAFTGATERRAGRFELADGGTLFLDEVCEMPQDTQVKLLRVLQEREFEAVGSSRTLTVDVRVIAASNRNLPAEVAAGRFRADLYHRLNVFPIAVPALRERRGDIPLLAEHFLARAARNVGKILRGIEAASLQLLVEHAWPGNIRELQNVIERAAILAHGPLLEIDRSVLGGGDSPASCAAAASTPLSTTHAAVATLAEVQRSHILAVLRKTRGVIEGADGAAALLNMKPSTARYRIRKLGIVREDYLPA